MNKYCECEIAGYCERHQLNKSKRKHELCSGQASTPDCGRSYFDAWERGELGATAPFDAKQTNDTDFCSHPAKVRTKKPRVRSKVRGAGDLIAAATRAIGIRSCRGCKRRQALLNHYIPANYEPPEPTVFDDNATKHLIYHVWPNNDEIWKWNVEQLVERWEIFNGRKVIGIAVSDIDDEKKVKSQFPSDAEFIVNQNDPAKGEMVNFIQLLESVESLGTNEVTFYGHAKGTKYDRIEPQHAGITKWAQCMYEILLDYPAVIDNELQKKAMCGVFSMVGTFPHFGAKLSHHYSGTFFWFRNLHVFSRNWRYTHDSYYGSEMWPGFLFKAEDISKLLPLPATKILSMYDANFWQTHMDPIVNRWKSAHSTMRATGRKNQKMI